MRPVIVAALAALVLTACAPGPEPGAEAPAPVTRPPEATVTTPPAPPTSTAPTATVTDEWAPDAWEPTVQITPASLSDDERRRARAEWLGYLERDGVAVPEVELIRWTLGPADFADTMAACLTDAGFLAVSDGHGTHFPEGIPAAQQEALDLANYVCAAQYSQDPRFTGDWTEEQLGLVHDYWVQYFIPCMAAHGHRIDDSDKPTREAFVATFHDGDTERWWPTDVLMSLDEQERALVTEACPELPPQKAMYGA